MSSFLGGVDASLRPASIYAGGLGFFVLYLMDFLVFLHGDSATFRDGFAFGAEVKYADMDSRGCVRLADRCRAKGEKLEILGGLLNDKARFFLDCRMYAAFARRVRFDTINPAGNPLGP